MLSFAGSAAARIDSSQFSSFGFRQHPGAQLPLDAKFRDDSGRPIALADAIGGRPSIIVLEYLRCQNLCSLVLTGATNALIKSNLIPGRQVNLVAISIDPRDTIQDAAKERAMYSARFPDPGKAKQGIRFLIGTPDEVARIADKVGFPYQSDKQSGQFAHPAGFVMATPKGRISRYLLGLNPPAAAVNKAVLDAQVGEITPPAHPLLLLCFGYDPDAGTAAALALRLVRLASLAIVLACAALIGFMSLRRRTV
jgi:protein SCO1/2